MQKYQFANRFIELCLFIAVYFGLHTKTFTESYADKKLFKNGTDINLQWRGWRADNFSIEVFIRDFSKVSESMYSIVITRVCVIFTLSKSVKAL